MSNARKLVETIAGTRFNIIDVDAGNNFLLEHTRCGHRFTESLTQISLRGIHCSRCEQTSIGSVMYSDAKDAKALRLYNQCKELIPDVFIIKGDTSDESNIISITDNMGNIYNVQISDLLENKELPDCLARREIATPSPALTILDTLFEDFTVLDDFSEINDIVRIRSNMDYSIRKMSIKEFIESKKQYEQDNQ